MDREKVEAAIDVLAEQFRSFDFTYYEAPVPPGSLEKEYTFHWFGEPNDEVLMGVFKDRSRTEIFHRHDFFFFNYAYRGAYHALSDRPDNLITVEEGDLYIGQPFNGYALFGNDEEEIVIVGVFIQKNVFYRDFLPALTSNPEMLSFFLEPARDTFAENSRHVKGLPEEIVRPLLEVMMLECVRGDVDSQKVLKPLALALAELAAQQYQREHIVEEEGVAADVRRYINENLARASLSEAARKLGYHPNYLSTLIRDETGLSFRELLKDARMSRAGLLLRGTDLSVEEIALDVGYTNTSNFYRAYRSYFGHTPREGGEETLEA